MAKHNYVLLNGMVTQEPRIIRDDEGNYLRAMCSLTKFIFVQLHSCNCLLSILIIHQNL